MIRIYGEFPYVDVGKIPEDPDFSRHVPNFNKIKKVAKNYSRCKNVVVIGNGGSINNFRAISTALQTEKKPFFIDTMEPEILERISNLCRPSDTVIIPISKSGNTVGVLESLMYFVNRKYDKIVSVTGGGALLEISKRMEWDVVEHPDIGGRFAGLTSCALFPSAVCGIDIKKIYKGAKKVYESRKIKRALYKLSMSLFELEKNGYNEIFMPVYSELLEGFLKIIVQLIHETTGKNELGQTIVGAIGPESQHHTNQRFFGGPKDMIGFFITVKKHKKICIRVPKRLYGVSLKGNNLSILNGLNLSDAIKYEFEGVVKTTSERRIPYFVMEIDKIDETSVGELLASWQYISYYSAVLRGQNPFDQPEVERSKEITLKLIKNLKRKRK